MWPSQQPPSTAAFSPVPTTAPSTSQGAGDAAQAASIIPEEYTLDESIIKTIWRDLKTIFRNVRSVLIPINWKFGNHQAALRDWDLWGPLIFMLVLAITLSAGEKNASQVFAMVFAEVAIGSILLTFNVILLGGEIVFLQSLCLFGYCLFPLVVAAIVCTFTPIKFVRILVMVGCLAWSFWATVPFIGNAVPKGRKFIAVYPVCLMYISISWLALMKTG